MSAKSTFMFLCQVFTIDAAMHHAYNNRHMLCVQATRRRSLDLDVHVLCSPQRCVQALLGTGDTAAVQFPRHAIFQFSAKKKWKSGGFVLTSKKNTNHESHRLPIPAANPSYLQHHSPKPYENALRLDTQESLLLTPLRYGPQPSQGIFAAVQQRGAAAYLRSATRYTADAS